MPRPSIGQRRLGEYMAIEKDLRLRLLEAINNALDTQTGRKLALISSKGKFYIGDQGTWEDGSYEEIIAWDAISASHLLDIYKQIVKTLSL